MKRQTETVLRLRGYDYVTPDNFFALCEGFVTGILKEAKPPLKIRLSIRAMPPTAKQGEYLIARRFGADHVRFGRKILFPYRFIGSTLQSIGVKAPGQEFWFKITAIKP